MQLLYVDLFCGAGGTTTGLLKCNGVKVVCCVNHDELAIKSHQANTIEDLIEDIRTLNTDHIVQLIKQ